MAVSEPPGPPHQPVVPPRPGQPVHRQPTGNGMAVAALVCGIVGAVLAFIPFLFFVGLILGILAIVFGAIGLSRANKGASGKGMAIAGLILGAVSLALGIFGAIVLNRAAHELVDISDQLGDLISPTP